MTTINGLSLSVFDLDSHSSSLQSLSLYLSLYIFIHLFPLVLFISPLRFVSVVLLFTFLFPSFLSCLLFSFPPLHYPHIFSALYPSLTHLFFSCHVLPPSPWHKLSLCPVFFMHLIIFSAFFYPFLPLSFHMDPFFFSVSHPVWCSPVFFLFLSIHSSPFSFILLIHLAHLSHLLSKPLSTRELILIEFSHLH